MPSLRAICKEIGSVQPHGEPLITYRTFDFDAPALKEWLGNEIYVKRQVVSIEVLPEPVSPAPVADDDVPF